MYKEHTQNRFKSIRALYHVSVSHISHTGHLNEANGSVDIWKPLVKFLLKTYLKTDKLHHVIPNQSTTNPYHLSPLPHPRTSESPLHPVNYKTITLDSVYL